MSRGLFAVVVVALAGCEGNSDESSATEPTIEQCLAEGEPSSCEALACRWHDTLSVDADTCTTSAGEGRCFTPAGQPIGQATELHAYYRMHGEQVEFMLYGYDCAEPLGWTECTTGGESPAECGCLCGMTIEGETVYCGESLLCGEDRQSSSTPR